jgi:hypothetical protein
MLDLSNVTIVSINGRDPENSAKAIDFSSREINFGAKLLITNKNVSFSGIETKIVNGLNSSDSYSYFCVKELTNFIQTDYCLTVQPDGYVVNPLSWSNSFLEYDYIGAPWPDFLTLEIMDKCNLVPATSNLNIVGNGGFSLRSKKFLKECSLLDYNDTSIEEDCFVSVYKRKELKNKNIKYSSFQIGQQFSIEHIINENSFYIRSFGFHGKLDHLTNYLNLLQ